MTTISLAPPLPAARGGSRCATAPASEGFGVSTRVRTLMGWQPVAALMAGDLVVDSAGNLHELRGIRRVQADGKTVVRIARKGRAPVTVGGGQSLCADDWRAQIVFGQAAVTVADRMVDGVALRRGRPGKAVLCQLQFDSVVCLDIDGAMAVVKPAL